MCNCYVFGRVPSADADGTPLAMGSYCHQPYCPCDHVYVPAPVVCYQRIVDSVRADYYYYATAGGARIWVCTFGLCCVIDRSSIIRLTVEEIPHDLPDCTVCHRSVRCVLRQ